MDRKSKEEFVAEFHGRLEKAEGSFLVEYKGLNVEALNRLRREFKQAGGEFQVVKNRLLKLACQQTETQLIRDQMNGPSAIALVYEDVVGPAKTLVDFGKEFKALRFKGGQISGKLVDEAGVKRLAELPGKDVLLAQALSAMQAVPAGLVRVLNGIILKLLYALNAIEEQKGASA